MKIAYKLPLWIALLASFTPLSNEAKTPHKELNSAHDKHMVARYTLIDLGETELDSSQLSNQITKFNLAPMINNQGQASANKKAGGFVFSLGKTTYTPEINDIKIYVHSINDNGDLLLSLTRGHTSIEWMVWSLKDGQYGNIKTHLKTLDPFKSDCCFTGFNTQSTAIGYIKSGLKNMPVKWLSDGQMQPIGKEMGIEVTGIPKGITAAGSIIGIAEDPNDKYPFFLADTGIELLKTYRHSLVPKGWIEFADMVVTNDDTVYGTFWLKDGFKESKAEKPEYSAYMWQPKTSEVKTLNLQNMRLSAVNSFHTLVGSLKGKAALRKLDQEPVLLTALVHPDELVDWDLLENTAINDQGQIVGYGTYRGKMHLYLANPGL